MIFQLHQMKTQHQMTAQVRQMTHPIILLIVLTPQMTLPQTQILVQPLIV